MKIQFLKKETKEKGALAIFATDGNKLTFKGQRLNEAAKGAIKKALKASRFTGKKGQATTLMPAPASGYDRIFVVGLGKAKDLNTISAEDAGAVISARLLRSGASEVTVLAEVPDDATTASSSTTKMCSLQLIRLPGYLWGSMIIH